jgi:hypothetical protein
MPKVKWHFEGSANDFGLARYRVASIPKQKRAHRGAPCRPWTTLQDATTFTDRASKSEFSFPKSNLMGRVISGLT